MSPEEQLRTALRVVAAHDRGDRCGQACPGGDACRDFVSAEGLVRGRANR